MNTFVALSFDYLTDKSILMHTNNQTSITYVRNCLLIFFVTLQIWFSFLSVSYACTVSFIRYCAVECVAALVRLCWTVELGVVLEPAGDVSNVADCACLTTTQHHAMVFNLGRNAHTSNFGSFCTVCDATRSSQRIPFVVDKAGGLRWLG